MTDVVPDGVVKEEHILIYHGNLLQHALRRHMIDGLPSDGDDATGWLIIFCNQIQDGGFAGAGIAHNGG